MNLEGLGHWVMAKVPKWFYMMTWNLSFFIFFITDGWFSISIIKVCFPCSTFKLLSELASKLKISSNGLRIALNRYLKSYLASTGVGNLLHLNCGVVGLSLTCDVFDATPRNPQPFNFTIKRSFLFKTLDNWLFFALEVFR
jgi:hypothetical protein